MNIEIRKTVENKLLKRKEIEAFIAEKDSSVKRLEIKAQLAKKLKADEKLLVVEKIVPGFGSRDVTVIANVYDDEATLKKLTAGHLVKRNSAPVAEAEE